MGNSTSNRERGGAHKSRDRDRDSRSGSHALTGSAAPTAGFPSAFTDSGFVPAPRPVSGGYGQLGLPPGFPLEVPPLLPGMRGVSHNIGTPMLPSLSSGVGSFQYGSYPAPATTMGSYPIGALPQPIMRPPTMVPRSAPIPTFGAAPITTMAPSYAPPVTTSAAYAAPMVTRPSYVPPVTTAASYAAPLARATYTAPLAAATYAAPVAYTPSYVPPVAMVAAPMMTTAPVMYDSYVGRGYDSGITMERPIERAGRDNVVHERSITRDELAQSGNLLEEGGYGGYGNYSRYDSGYDRGYGNRSYVGDYDTYRRSPVYEESRYRDSYNDRSYPLSYDSYDRSPVRGTYEDAYGSGRPYSGTYGGTYGDSYGGYSSPSSAYRGTYGGSYGGYGGGGPVAYL